MLDERDYTCEAILQRMLDKIPDTIDKREGSIIYDALAPAATELAKLYINLKHSIDLVFADTAVEEYLDKICNQIGLKRKEATSSIKKGSFFDADGKLMNVEIGNRFTCEESYWIVVEKISDGIYQLESENAGSFNNSITGNLIPIDYISGLGTAILTDILIPGEDEETDDELRQRYFESINEKAFAGNIADYKKQTKAISGVGAVKVFPVWNGGGTVKLTILDSDFDKASDMLIQKVQDELCPNSSDKGLGLAPIGHVVTVDTVTEYEINMSTNIIITESSSIDIIRQQINQQLNNYLLELRKSWEDEEKIIVRVSQIESRILNIEGVLDVTNTIINENSGNIELEEMQIPILGEVNIV